MWDTHWMQKLHMKTNFSPYFDEVINELEGISEHLLIRMCYFDHISAAFLYRHYKYAAVKKDTN